MANGDEYDVVVARNVGMTTRDGVRLAADIFRPARDGEALPGPFPAIMTRSPYNTRSGKGPSSQARNGEFFARNGYLYISQDCRGRWESDGEFVLLDGEGEDGYDAIEWVASLPWCNGKVGTQGTSLRAWNQNAAALERPPHLVCMWINQGGSNGNRNALRQNGAMELRWLAWAMAYAPVSKEAQADPALQAELTAEAERAYEWLTRLPWSRGNSPLARLPGWERWALDLLTHADDGPFWQNPTRNFEPYVENSADVPTMYAGAWYDSYALATVEKFNWFADRLKHQYLLMGPGIHGGPNFDNPLAGEVSMGPRGKIAGNLAESRLHMMRDWFDHWLKGVDNGVADMPRVRLFVMGGAGTKDMAGRLVHGGDWIEAEAWPPREARDLSLYLQPGGGLAEEAPDTASGAGEGATSFRFDPADPLPTIAGNVSSMTENLTPPARVKMPEPTYLRRSMVIQGAADQVTREDLHCEAPFGAPLADRPDVITFETAPLDHDLIVAGPVHVDLRFSSDAPDTDLFCMLLDIYPPSKDWPEGYRLNICDGLMRVRYRDGMASPKLMTPGEIVRVAYEIYPTANRFARGHCLQLLISSSSFPRFDVNPNTGEPIGQHKGSQIANNTIHHAADHPSVLKLKVLDSGAD